MAPKSPNADPETEFEAYMTGPADKPSLLEWPWIWGYAGLLGIAAYGVYLYAVRIA